MKGIPIDPDSDVVEEHFAVVYAPRKGRGRFAENCVRVTATADEAIEQSDVANKHYPARVIGPSRSSEGVRLYYLQAWLDDE